MFIGFPGWYRASYESAEVAQPRNLNPFFVGTLVGSRGVDDCLTVTDSKPYSAS